MKVAVLDEEGQSIEQIKKTVSELFDEWSVFHYTTSFALVTGVTDELKGDVDLIMIHVPLHKQELIDMAKDIQSYFQHVRIIFFSENNNLAQEIFLARPSYFLKIPFTEHVLIDALNRIKDDCKMDVGQTLNIRSKGVIHRIRYESISYIESVGRKMRLYTSGGFFDIYMKMDDVCKILPPQFKRCHRSYIVNVNKISQISSDGISLEHMEYIPLSRTYQNSILHIFEDALGKDQPS